MLRLRGLPQGSLRKVKNNKTAPFPYRTSSMPAFGLGCCDRCHSYSSNNPLFFWTPPIYFWTTSEAWRSCAAVPDFRVWSWQALAFSAGGDGEIEQKLLDVMAHIGDELWKRYAPTRPERARAF